MKTNKNNLQQCDVLMKRLNSLPEGKKKILQKKRLVLAEGEKTGHAHVIEDDESELIQIGDKILLSLNEKSVLTHQEHGNIAVEPGLFEIGQVREHDYFSQMVNPVKD